MAKQINQIWIIVLILLVVIIGNQFGIFSTVSLDNEGQLNIEDETGLYQYTESPRSCCYVGYDNEPCTWTYDYSWGTESIIKTPKSVFKFISYPEPYNNNDGPTSTVTYSVDIYKDNVQIDKIESIPQKTIGTTSFAEQYGGRFGNDPPKDQRIYRAYADDGTIYKSQRAYESYPFGEPRGDGEPEEVYLPEGKSGINVIFGIDEGAGKYYKHRVGGAYGPFGYVIHRYEIVPPEDFFVFEFIDLKDTQLENIQDDKLDFELEVTNNYLASMGKIIITYSTPTLIGLKTEQLTKEVMIPIGKSIHDFAIPVKGIGEIVVESSIIMTMPTDGMQNLNGYGVFLEQQDSRNINNYQYINLKEFKGITKLVTITKEGLTIQDYLDIIDELEATITEKTAMIESLTQNLNEQAQIVNQMEATIEEKAQIIQQLTSNINEQNELISQLELNLEEKITLVEELTTNINEQALIIQALTSQAEEQAEIISNLELTISEQADLISQMELTVYEQSVIINDLNLEIQEQAQIIDDLNLNLQQKIELISQLELTNQEQEELIAQMNLSFAEQQEILDALNIIIENDAQYILDLEMSISESAIYIDSLKLTISQQASLISQLQLSNQEQADLISQLKLNNEETAQLIIDLNLKISDQAETIDNLNLIISDDAEIIKNLNLKISDQANLIDSLNLTINQQIDLISQLELSIEEEKQLVEQLSLTISEQQLVIEGLQGGNGEIETGFDFQQFWEDYQILIIIGGGILFLLIIFGGRKR